MGEFPSGQRGQTVNLLALPSVVRIHLRPSAYQSKLKDVSAQRVKVLFQAQVCSILYGCRSGGTGRRPGLKIPWVVIPVPVRFRSAAVGKIRETLIFQRFSYFFAPIRSQSAASDQPSAILLIYTHPTSSPLTNRDSITG